MKTSLCNFPTCKIKKYNWTLCNPCTVQDSPTGRDCTEVSTLPITRPSKWDITMIFLVHWVMRITLMDLNASKSLKNISGQSPESHGMRKEFFYNRVRLIWSYWLHLSLLLSHAQEIRAPNVCTYYNLRGFIECHWCSICSYDYGLTLCSRFRKFIQHREDFLGPYLQDHGFRNIGSMREWMVPVT